MSNIEHSTETTKRKRNNYPYVISSPQYSGTNSDQDIIAKNPVSKPPSEPPLILPLEKILSSHSTGTCNDDLVRAGGIKRILKENRNMVRKNYILDSVFKSVCNCGRNVVPDREVEIWERATGQDEAIRVSYKNLIRCGSVWICPECSYKIRSTRRDELMTMFNGLQSDGYHLIFLTLTKRHKMVDSKHYDRDKFKSYNKDWEKTNTCRIIRDLKAQFGIKNIRTIDFTYSYVNGFHPHLHIVLAYKIEFKKLNPTIIGQMISESYTEKWLSLNESAVMEAQDAEIVGNQDCKYGESVMRYIAKVTLVHEMTDAKHAKNTTGININPMAIPDMLRTGEYGCYTKEQLIEIYGDFGFKTKGIRFMGYTKGLKEKYLIEEKTDDEVVTDTENLVNLLFTIEWPVWYLIINQGLEIDLQCEIERLIEANHDPPPILNWLESKLNKRLCISTYDNYQDTPFTIDESVDGKEKFIEKNEQINRIQLNYRE
ncbi:hypothetical protein ES705_16511 [subsurface metagenome]